MTCLHAQTKSSGERPYSGSVAVHPYTDENPSAHGCITVTRECRACGARRDVNINQRHAEYGPWGKSRAARLLDARNERAKAREAVAAVQPLVLTNRKSGRTAVVSIDSEAMLIVEGVAWAQVERLVSQSAWLERAKAAREAVVQAQRAAEAAE